MVLLFDGSGGDGGSCGGDCGGGVWYTKGEMLLNHTTHTEMPLHFTLTPIYRVMYGIIIACLLFVYLSYIA